MGRISMHDKKIVGKNVVDMRAIKTKYLRVQHREFTKQTTTLFYTIWIYVQLQSWVSNDFFCLYFTNCTSSIAINFDIDETSILASGLHVFLSVGEAVG